MEPPAPPYPGFLPALAERLERDVRAATPLSSPHRGAPEEVREALAAAVERNRDALVGLSHALHADPEVGFAEHRAVDRIGTLLEGAGHDVEIGTGGLATALRASAGSGSPQVAVLAEYDALPGLGHACGHNVIAATAVGAFLALAEHADELGGCVVLLGTPAEEGGGGKELLARAGVFDDVDAAMMVHPLGLDIAEHPWLGVRQVAVTYHGLAAHASMMPFLGRNALDAVVQAYTGVAALRQHLLPSDRIHGIITDGGQRPNIVPERAAATFYLRSAEPETLAILSERARGIFEAAATATGTRVEIDWDPCPVYLPVRTNRALAGRYAANLAPRGRRVLPAGVVPEELTASTDMGNVSVRLPAIHPTLAIAPPTATLHTSEFARWAVSDLADRGVVDGAVGLALTAADFLCDADLRAAVAEEFAAAGGPLDLDDLLG